MSDPTDPPGGAPSPPSPAEPARDMPTRRDVDLSDRELRLRREIYDLNVKIAKVREEDAKQANVLAAAQIHALEEEKKLKQLNIELAQAQSEGTKEEIARLNDLVAQQKKHIETQDEELKLRKEGIAIGKVAGSKLISINNQVLQQAQRITDQEGKREGVMGGLSQSITNLGAAFLQSSAGTMQHFASMNILYATLDKVFSMTKDLILEFDKLQASFVKSTGLSREFSAQSLSLRQEVSTLGISVGDLAETTDSLVNKFKDFTHLSEAQRKEFTLLSAQLDKLGFDSAGTAEALSNIVHMDPGTTRSTMMDLAGTADALGVSMQELSSDFAGSGEILAKFGESGIEVFKGLAAEAKLTGMSVSQLQGLMGQYDTFENAAEAAGRLNMVLGGNLIDTYTLLNATEAERAQLLRESMQSSGRDFESMSRFQRRELARAMGMSVEETARLLSSTSQEVERTAAEIMNVGMSQEELAQRTRDASTAMEKFTVLFGNLAVAAGPIVSALNTVVNAFLSFGTTLDKVFGKGIASTVLAFGTFMLGLKLLQLASRKALRFIKTQIGEVLSKITDAATGTTESVAESAGKVTKSLSEGVSKGLEGLEPGVRSFGNAIGDAGKAAKQGAKGLLAVGAAFLMIGGGIAIAALGMAEFVKAFAGFDAGQILAISFALGVFGATMVLMLAGLGLIVASGVGVAAVGAILAIGAAFLMMGGGVALAAFGMSLFVKSFNDLSPAQAIAAAAGLWAFSAALVTMTLALAGFAFFATNPLLWGAFAMLAGALIALNVAFGAFVFIFNKLDAEKASSMATILESLVQIGSLSSGLSDANTAIRDIIEAINGIEDTTKLVTFQGVTEGIANALREIDELENIDNITQVVQELSSGGNAADALTSQVELSSGGGAAGALTSAQAALGTARDTSMISRMQSLFESSLGGLLSPQKLLGGEKIVIELDGKKLGQWMDNRENSRMKRVVRYRT